jgi:hypothetical protein
MEHEERMAQINRDQQAENERRARVNAEAMARLRGIPVTNIGINDPHREEAIQWRRSYPGIQAYDANWRRQHGVPEHLINHPFNMY